MNPKFHMMHLAILSQMGGKNNFNKTILINGPGILGISFALLIPAIHVLHLHLHVLCIDMVKQFSNFFSVFDIK